MRVGITQRVDSVPHYSEVRDCLDHKWVLFLETLGLQVILIPNQLQDPVNYYQDLRLEGLILSGGNDPAILASARNFSEQRDSTEAKLIITARSMGHPLLGVCRGMQFLCLQMGESLVRVKGHVAKRHSLICDPDFSYPNNSRVNSYHNWGLLELERDSPFRIMATTGDQCIEAVKHLEEPTYGIMWHPERESAFSKHDLNLFKQIFKNDKSDNTCCRTR